MTTTEADLIDDILLTDDTDTADTDSGAPVDAAAPTAPAPVADVEPVEEVMPIPPPAPAPSAPRSDEELLAVLEGEVSRTGKRPTRQEVMTAATVGTGRATRLLTELDRRHDWPDPVPVTRPTGTRTGTGSRTRARSARARRTEPVPTLTDPPTAPPVDPLTDPPGDIPTRPVPTVSTGTEPAAPMVVAGPVPVVDPHAGRLVSWVAFVFGSVMSIAANVLHTWLPAVHEPAGWNPGLAPQIGAAVWPIGLLLSVEVLSRVHWHKGWAWFLARYLGAGTVALGSAVISYGHLRDVLTAWGYGHPGADVGPLVLDGLMVIAGFALLAIGRPPVPAAPAV
ncbi:MAG TPA: hypothetical protein VHX38_00675 [Pseudonocardiaceae bacterium]|jgi:hypothetical protein|nr:hypothetical protein [Pseudonocardiaceae bacterium]